jgi:parallel beta-helix repeat protein
MGKNLVNSFKVLGLLSVLFLSVSAFRIQTAKAVSGTIYIRANGSVDPPTAPISTVDNVTYILTGDVTSDADGIVVEKNDTLVDGLGYTVQGIDAALSVGVDLTGRSNVTIKNMSIRAFGRGIHLNYSSSNSLIGNNITKTWGGISLDSSSNNILNGNNITANNIAGVYFDYSSNNSISGNNITANAGNGVYLELSPNNTIGGNNLTANAGDGIFLELSSNSSVSGNTFSDDGLRVVDSIGNVVVDNLVNGKPLIYLEDVSDHAVVDAGQVILVNCNRISVQNLNISHTSVAIEMWNTSNTQLTGNNIANNYRGIVLSGSSSNNSVSGNSMAANNDWGVSLESSSNNSVSGNNIVDNSGGISLFVSFNNSVTGNNIVNSGGIRLSMAGNNTISGNNLVNNSCGLIDATFLGPFENNRVYNNNFINNTWQVQYGPGVSSESLRSWDAGYPVGGNYWSDYSGTDVKSGRYQNETGSDGIGDTPYRISGMDNDSYPLTGMFSDFNAILENGIQTICNSTISNFQSNSTAISFNVSGENGTFGFCRICIPTALMNATYKVFINGTEIPYSLLSCSNETNSYLYFNYTHSTQKVVIIPEIPSFLALALFMIATPFTVIIHKRKHST